VQNQSGQVKATEQHILMFKVKGRRQPHFCKNRSLSFIRKGISLHLRVTNLDNRTSICKDLMSP